MSRYALQCWLVLLYDLAALLQSTPIWSQWHQNRADDLQYVCKVTFAGNEQICGLSRWYRCSVLLQCGVDVMTMTVPTM